MASWKRGQYKKYSQELNLKDDKCRDRVIKNKTLLIKEISSCLSFA